MPSLPIYNHSSQVWNYFEVLRLLHSITVKDASNLGKPNGLNLKTKVRHFFIYGEPDLDRQLPTASCFRANTARVHLGDTIQVGFALILTWNVVN